MYEHGRAIYREGKGQGLAEGFEQAGLVLLCVCVCVWVFRLVSRGLGSELAVGYILRKGGVGIHEMGINGVCRKEGEWRFRRCHTVRKSWA